MNRTQQKTIALLEHLFGLGEAQRIYDALSDERQSSLDVVRLTESIKRSHGHDKIR